MESKVIVIIGPTCSGKTDLGIEISKKIDSEIISADSRQIYKYLNIGTAKPSPSQLAQVKHHFIDILEPNEAYNVSMFESEALNIIKFIINNGKTPIIVGGSGLYIKGIVDGIFNSADTDEEFRKELQALRSEYGNEYLYNKLKKIDPASAASMLPQNWKRVIRALEVYHLTGKTIVEHHAAQKREISYNFLQYGLEWNRETLYRNIEYRVDKMIEDGLVEEVKTLLETGYGKNLNTLNTVGYKEIYDYLEGVHSLDTAIELIKRNTRRYAKRQLTWFRADNRIKWIPVNSKDQFKNIADFIINDFNKLSDTP